MQINFILPFFTPYPGGGIKIMYEYANRLSILGCEVRIYHSLNTPYIKYPVKRPFIIRKLISLTKYRNKPVCTWFTFNEGVELLFLNRVSNKYIKDADATISTWWSLVEPVSKLSERKGIKINLIQGYENWDGYVDKLHDSYRIKNVSHVAISPFIMDIISFYNKDCIFIPNAVDSAVYYKSKLFSKRNSLSFCMCYSTMSIKGFDIGLNALIKLKEEKYPDLKLTVFGTVNRPNTLPSWIIYHKNPSDLNRIYNSCRYFISNSLNEGWGLPIHEAMNCGCVVICTKIDGHRQFYDRFKGVFTYEAANSIELYKTIDYVLGIEISLLESYSDNNATIKDIYSWDNAVNSIISIIKKNRF